MTDYHVPVMLREAIEGLAIDPNGIYVDLTFGGGGHSKAIIDKLDKGHLYAFDQDKDAMKNAQAIDSSSFTFVKGNFRFLKKFLRAYGVSEVNGILGDLGISSHHINEPDRGFSTRFEGPLDMRMDTSSTTTAKDIISKSDEEDLRSIFRQYGELRNASAVSRMLISARSNREIHSTTDLVEVLRPLAPRGRENKFFAQVFQAIRLKVNDEISALREALTDGAEILCREGRYVLMTYHSLEDRLVKNFFNKGNFEGMAEKDFYGNLIRILEPVTRKPIIPSAEEIQLNNRARSAKLRIARKH